MRESSAAAEVHPRLRTEKIAPPAVLCRTSAQAHNGAETGSQIRSDVVRERSHIAEIKLYQLREHQRRGSRRQER